MNPEEKAAEKWAKFHMGGLAKCREYPSLATSLAIAFLAGVAWQKKEAKK